MAFQSSDWLYSSQHGIFKKRVYHLTASHVASCHILSEILNIAYDGCYGNRDKEIVVTLFYNLAPQWSTTVKMRSVKLTLNILFGGGGGGGELSELAEL